MNKRGADGGYGVFCRLMYILDNKGFYLKNYMQKFEVSRRTAMRDIRFIRTYKDYDLKFENGRYNLIVIQ